MFILRTKIILTQLSLYIGGRGEKKCPSNQKSLMPLFILYGYHKQKVGKGHE